MLATRPSRRRVQPADEQIDLTPRPVRLLEYDESRDYKDRWYFATGEGTETVEDRVDGRYLTDDRLGNLRTLVVISGREYSFIKPLNSRSNTWRRQLRELSPIDEDEYTALADAALEAENLGDLSRVDQIAAQMRELDERRNASPNIAHINAVRELLINAIPESAAPGITPVWPIRDLFAYARKVKWLDGWYEPVKKNPPGRRWGSKNRPKS